MPKTYEKFGSATAPPSGHAKFIAESGPDEPQGTVELRKGKTYESRKENVRDSIISQATPKATSEK